MRLFVGLDIDEAIRTRIAQFLDSIRGLAPEARWVSPDSLHVTLKFIGEKSEDDANKVKQTLETISAGPLAFEIKGHGFFPSARAPRVFWIGVEAGPQLADLAATVDAKLASLNIPKEEHSFHPHLTLARGFGGSASARRKRGDRPNRNFQKLQEKLAALPMLEFGTITAREFFLYESQPSRGGSKYTRLAGFPLQ